ncbi:uncharacterized protein LOC120423759 [Culex pipiens pallens]|uniref:uncharacterized protein LOC120423759 n=1 Tax=Culex pipiens pallens TaxID=42434 RepID=UPI001953BC7E|nr:uncharacterized protein LOC120423759 [Culex pipiens pallens]
MTASSSKRERLPPPETPAEVGEHTQSKLIKVLAVEGLRNVFDPRKHLMESCTNFPTCLEWHTSFGSGILFFPAQFHTHICTLFRVLWVFLIGFAVYGAFFVGRSQWVRFQASPTVIQLDKNYREWVGTMPAATVCFHNRFDLGRARDYIVR